MRNLTSRMAHALSGPCAFALSVSYCYSRMCRSWHLLHIYTLCHCLEPSWKKIPTKRFENDSLCLAGSEEQDQEYIDHDSFPCIKFQHHSCRVVAAVNQAPVFKSVSSSSNLDHNHHCASSPARLSNRMPLHYHWRPLNAKKNPAIKALPATMIKKLVAAGWPPLRPPP